MTPNGIRLLVSATTLVQVFLLERGLRAVWEALVRTHTLGVDGPSRMSELLVRLVVVPLAIGVIVQATQLPRRLSSWVLIVPFFLQIPFIFVTDLSSMASGFGGVPEMLGVSLVEAVLCVGGAWTIARVT